MSFDFVTGFEEFSQDVLEELFVCDDPYKASIVSSGRRGGNCLKLYNSVNSTIRYHYKEYSAALGSIVIGGAIKIADTSVEDERWYLYITESNNNSDYHVRVKFTSTELTIHDASGADAGSYSQDFTSDFVFFEIELDCSGTLKIWLFEQLVADLVGTFDAGTGVITHYGFYGSDAFMRGPFLVDDFYVDTDTRRGDIAVFWFPPTADVDVDFTPSTGVDNYATVDEVPNNDTDYTESAVIGDADLYSHSSTFGSVIGDILAVQVMGRVNVPDGGVGTGIIPKLKISGTEYSETQIDGTNVTKENISGEFTVNPATGVAFTLAEIEALDGFGWEIGS